MKKNEQTGDALQRLLENAPAAGLTERDIETLQQVIAAFRGWQVLGHATKWLMAALVMVAGAAVAWDTLKEHAKGWLGW